MIHVFMFTVKGIVIKKTEMVMSIIFYGVDNDHAIKKTFWKSTKLEIVLLRNTLLNVQQLDFKLGECEDEFNTASGSEI